MPQLNFMTEGKLLKTAAIESNKGFAFKCAVATQPNFVQMLSKSPKIVHISCHGIQNSPQGLTVGKRDEGDHLLFEHDKLMGELISEKSLKNLVSNVNCTELVFLAACHSEFAVKIFLKKGARHVICVEKSSEVLDEAVFNGQPICTAFTAAQNLITNMHEWHEARVFKLFKNDQNHDKCCHSITLDDNRKFCNLSDKILVKEIPAKIENIKFREKDMSKLIQKIMQGQRLVFIFGLLGVGKSVIARNVLHFMKERKYFCGGIILLQLNGTKTLQALCHSLYRVLFKNLVVDDNDPYFEGLVDSMETQVEFFIDFFNLATDFKLKTVEKHPDLNLSKNERYKKFLVCLDNVEELIAAKNSELKLLLKKLLNSCPYLQIVITSRRHLAKLNDECIDPDLMFVPPLKGTQAVKLFLFKAERHQTIDVDEIFDLIMMDPNFEVLTFTGGAFSELSTQAACEKRRS